MREPSSEESREKGEFYVERGVETTDESLKGGGGEHVRGGIPANI